MKTFRQFLEESESPTTTTDGVENPESVVVAKPIKQSFLGYECFEVDEETYHKCVNGKIPFSRWAKLIEDEDLRNEMRSSYHRNKRIVVKSGNKASFLK